MAVQIPQGYRVTSLEPIDSRLIMTKEQMRNAKDEWMPEVYFCVCSEAKIVQGQEVYSIYIYNKSNTFDPETGKFRIFAGDYEDLTSLPSINGMPVLGSEDGGHYFLQDLLEPEWPIQMDSEVGHHQTIRVVFDGKTIKAGSEGLYVDGKEIDLSDNSEIAGLKKGLEDEEAARLAGDSELANDIKDEEEARIAGDSELAEDIKEEEAARILADSELAEDIAEEEAARIIADSGLQERLDSETLARRLADSELQDAIDSEARTRAQEIARLDSEKQDRLHTIFPLQMIGTSELRIKFDDETIKLDSSEGIYVPIDGETIILNSENELEVDLDDKTIVLGSEGLEVVEEQLDLDVNPDFIRLGSELDSERFFRIEGDSELLRRINSEAIRIDAIEEKVFFGKNSEGHIIPIHNYDNRPELAVEHFRYTESANDKYVPFDFPTYEGVVKSINDAGTPTKYNTPENSTLRAKLAHVTPEDRNKWNSAQRKLILEDTSTETLYKNALLLYPHPSQTTKPVDVASLRVDNKTIVIDSENFLRLHADCVLPISSEGNLVIVTNSEGKPYWASADRFGKVDDVRVNNTSIVRNKIANLKLKNNGGLEFSTSEDSEGLMFVDIYDVLPARTTSQTEGKALILDSENHLSWGEAGKVDALKVRDALSHEKQLDPVNKIITINVDKGLQITSEGKIIHINEVTPQTRTTNHILVPAGTDAQGHIIDGTTGTVANGLRELTFNDRTNNAGAYVDTSKSWAIIADPTNVTNTTNVALKIAGFDGTKAAGHKYDNATLMIDANGLQGNYKVETQKILPTDTSEGLIVLNGNKVKLADNFLGRITLNDFRKGQIDYEGLNDSEDRFYPTIQLLNTELEAKQDVLTPIWPITIGSEESSEANVLKLHYDGNTIISTPTEGLRAGDLILSYISSELYLHQVLPNTLSEGDPLINEGTMEDAISSNLGKFIGNYDSEGALPSKTSEFDIDRNDYAFVTVPVYDSQGNVEYFYHRYKFVDDTSETGHWQFEYQVSGSTFTRAQLDALNSKWTEQLTNAYKNHVTNLDPLHLHVTQAEKTAWNAKQDVLSAGDHINATSLAAKTIKVDTQTSIVDATTNDSKIPTIGAIKNYFKKKQSAVDSNSVTASSEGTYFISRIQQDAQGVITPTKVQYTYNNIPNKPQINGITVEGNKTLAQLGLAAADGIKIETDGKTVKHTNAVTAQATQEVYNLTYDAQGHITGTPVLYNPNWVTSVNNRTVTSPTDSDIIKTVPNILQGTDTNRTAVVIAGSNTASGANAVAEGSGTTASGNYSHAEGNGSVASNAYAHAEGDHSTASGDTAHAEGNRTTASGTVAHAEGNTTIASGNYSHAEGHNTTASGIASHASGIGSVASGNYSYAEGEGTKAASRTSHVQGKYNVEDTAGLYADIVGWGTSEGDRKNISSLTTTGDLHLKGKVYINSADNGTGGIELVPDITGKAGKVLAVKANGTALEWVDQAAGGGGVSFNPGNGLDLDSENNLNVTFGPYQAGPGITIDNSTYTISAVSTAPSFSQITGNPTDNALLAQEFTEINSELGSKQDKLTAGFGIEINSNVVSAAIGAGDGLGWDDSEATLSIISPIKGQDGIKVDGGWDSEGWTIKLDTGAVIANPGKVPTGQDVSDYANANFKKIQTPVADVTASGSTTEFISSVTQDAQGKITVEKKALDLSGINIGNGTISISVAGSAAQTFSVNQATNSTLSFPISYNSLTDKPTIPTMPTVNNATLSIQNGDGTTTYGTFTANAASNVAIKIPAGTVVDIERW